MMARRRRYRRSWRRMSRRERGALVLIAALVFFAGTAGHAVAAAHRHHHAAVVTTSASGNVALGQRLASGYGWGSGQQWTCLYDLWQRESGWSATATNPTSGAYGVAQSLHGDQGGTGGDEYNAADPEGLTAGQLAAANDGGARQQIRWGLAYITATYGTPCGAWSHEVANGWY